MNISSVVISLSDFGFVDGVLGVLENIAGCEVVTSGEGKIVALISAQNIDEEIAIFRRIERIDGVSGVAMVYSYQEELEGDLAQLSQSDGLSEMLKNENLKAEDIVYKGHVGFKK